MELRPARLTTQRTDRYASAGADAGGSQARTAGDSAGGAGDWWARDAAGWGTTRAAATRVPPRPPRGGKAATSTWIWITHRHSLPWAFQTMGRTAPNPAQHRPHYPACRPPTSACGSKSKLHALAGCCGLRVRCLVSMPGRHERLHHHRRPARARRRQNGRGLSLL